MYVNQPAGRYRGERVPCLVATKDEVVREKPKKCALPVEVLWQSPRRCWWALTHGRHRDRATCSLGTAVSLG